MMYVNIVSYAANALTARRHHGLLSTLKEAALHEGIQLLNGKKKFSGNLEALALSN